MKVNMTQGRSMRRSPARLGSTARAAATCTMLVFLLPLVLQVEAQKIKIQCEKTTDFSKFKTYAWVPGTPVFDPHLDTYIQDRFVAELRRSGMSEAPVNAADVLVTYHAAHGTDLNVGTALDPTFAASGGIPIAGHSIWETTSTGGAHVTKGSIAFELLDRVANRPVWIGTAKHTVSDAHHERWNEIEKALDKLLRRFPLKPA
jgi:Domain of unknown function (DUF4136)